MAKRVEKGPVLFVDTAYKGCEIEEQSIYKTPQTQQKDIISSDFVHTYDSLKEDEVTLEPVSSFQNHVLEEASQTFEFNPDAYETVNIIVDEVGGEKEDENANLYEETQYINFFSTDAWEPVDLEQHVLTMEQEEVQPQPVLAEAVTTFIETNDNLDDEKQETISFIRDLVERPLMMKPPVVQIFTTQGEHLTGKITSMSEQTIMFEDFMEAETELDLSNIEGIRILQL